MLPILMINMYNGFEEINYNDSSTIIFAEGGYTLNATSINNNLIFTDFIDSETKDNNSANHSDTKNRIGFDLDYHM